MQSIESSTTLAPLSSLDHIQQLINESLRHDWILRVEHCNQSSACRNDWQQWRTAKFAVVDAAPVIQDILSCRASHPDHAVRLSAQKTRPEVHLVYWVHRPQETRAMNDLPPQAANSGAPAQNSTYPRRVAGKIMGAWRYVVLAGMLFGSVLLIEESVFADGLEQAAFTQQPGD